MSAQYENNPLVKRYMELDVSPAFDAYTGVEIVVDENTTYFAGSTGGRIITINNPWGTQAMADNILENLRGFTYQPYTASGALLSPAAEIGDAVTLDVSTYSGIFKMSKNFSSLMSTDIEAPQDEEIDHEYPFEPKQNREITRKFSAIESEFAIQSNEISAKVSQTGGDASSVSWSLTSTAWTVKANGTEVFKVDRNGATVTGKITATSGKIGGFEIGTSAITYNKQTWGGTSVSGIYFGTSGLQIGRKPKNSNDNTSYFAASASGTIEARNLKLLGSIYFADGTSLTTANVQKGINSVNTNGSTWTGTSTKFDNASNNSSAQSSLPKVWRAMDIVGIDTVQSNNGQFAEINSYVISWKQVTIGGETFYVLKGVR